MQPQPKASHEREQQNHSSTQVSPIIKKRENKELTFKDEETQNKIRQKL
jgi:hypothetical protein